MLLLTVSSSRLVRPDGIHFQGFRYTSPVLAGFVRETVYIRYNPKDLGQIRAFYEGKYLCTAICTELSGITCSIKDVIQARNHQRRELKKAIESKVSIVAEYLAVHRPKTTLPMVQEEAATEKVVQTRLKKYEC